MAKLKTNQEGGAVVAKDPGAAGKQLESNQKGAAKYAHKGAADYDTTGEKGSHGHPHGAARMGYNQSFGAARMGGYAKGAAKVADIMTNGGAARYMAHGPADAGHRPDAHTHKSSGSYGLNPNSDGKGRGSLVGQKADNGLTITHDPVHSDLGALNRFSNQMVFDDNSSSSTWPGDRLGEVRRTGGSAGSVNRRGETMIGANFFPPEKKISTPTVKTGFVTDSRTGRPVGDGDTILNDSNQDGTMLGRGLSAVKNYFSD